MTVEKNTVSIRYSFQHWRPFSLYESLMEETFFNHANFDEVFKNASLLGNLRFSTLGNNRMEVSIKLRLDTSMDWSKWLFPIAEAFNSSFLGLNEHRPNVPRVDFIFFLRPSIGLPSKKVFQNLLMTQHYGVRLGAIFFGNLSAEQVLYVHWEVSYYLDGDSPKIKSREIKAHFSHDENYALFKFQNFEPFFEKRVRTEVPKYYTIKLFYKNIIRVIVDLNTVDCSRDGLKAHRVHFVLQSPVEISGFIDINEQANNRSKTGRRTVRLNRGRLFNESAESRSLTDSTVFSMNFESEDGDRLYEILSRIVHRCGVQVTFANVLLVNQILYYQTNRMNTMRKFSYVDISSPEFTDIIYKTVRPDILFGFLYFIDGLLSRGAFVKDQLLCSAQKYRQFLDALLCEYRIDSERCISCCEQLLNTLDEHREGLNILTEFTQLVLEYANTKQISELVPKAETDGYVRCRKVIITPTRIIYMAPEMMMGNKVIRNHSKDGDSIVRVSLRDDDGNTMRGSSTSDSIIDQVLTDVMLKPTEIGGEIFNYLGHSNSQMRDHGLYLYKGSREECDRICNDLGDFTHLSTPKMMARYGQCFTQCKESSIPIDFRLVDTRSYDLIGGCDSLGNPFTFSDGIGRISSELMHKISPFKDYAPSSMQIRYRGAKGMISIDPTIDERWNFYESLDLIQQDKKKSRLENHKIGQIRLQELAEERNMKIHIPFHVYLRDSQVKFLGATQSGIDIVKWSAPARVSLNRPWINILDQVSEMQSYDAHQRVCRRIAQLLDRTIANCTRPLYDEKYARDKLNDLPVYVNIDALTTICGFYLSEEPFFHSLVKAHARYAIVKKLKKQQIDIPLSLGRNMFGTVDESGLLQYGQIFVQYSVNGTGKVPGGPRKILTGNVLVMKNPCIGSGDVRIFEAVDIGCLHHKCDEVVFPQHGPRPHPDEMAGSDLDGDEYSVVWDPDLMFDYNEEAQNFTKSAVESKRPADANILDAKKEFYLNYIKNDSVGTVSYAHLSISDLYGINSTVAQRIALSHSDAVDFPKTGVPAKQLSEDWAWEQNPNSTKGDGIYIPPQRPQLQPDFMEKHHVPSYKSTRMLGNIYREIKSIQDIFNDTMDRDEQISQISVDPEITVEGWEEYEHEAREDFDNYTSTIKRLMECYGIHTEAELLSSCIVDMRNKINDRDNDDQSFFNTASTIEKRISDIWVAYRKNFFEAKNKYGKDAFGKYESQTIQLEKITYDSNNPVHRYVAVPHVEMMKKAVAYYKMCYGHEILSDGSEKRILSFPWLVWDIIRHVKKESQCRELKDDEASSIVKRMNKNAFFWNLENEMTKFCEKRQDGVNEMLLLINRTPMLLEYCRVYDGLSKILFVLIEWTKAKNALSGSFRMEHVAILFMQFALGGYFEGANKMYLPKIDPSIGDVRQLDNSGEMVTYFLQFLSSRSFRNVDSLSFEEFGSKSCFFENEWEALSMAAFDTYYDVVFSSNFDVLLQNKNKSGEYVQFLKEATPFVTVLPEALSKEQLDDFCAQLTKKTGIKEIQIRPKAVNRTMGSLMYVSAFGNSVALRNLREILMVRPPFKVSVIVVLLNSCITETLLDHLLLRKMLNYFYVFVHHEKLNPGMDKLYGQDVYNRVMDKDVHV